MIGMKNIQEVVSAEELSILRVLEDSLQQEQLELRQLQRRLVDALQLVNRLLEAGNTGTETARAEAELAIANVATITTAPESAPVITITEEIPTETAPLSEAEILQERIRQRAAEIYVECGCEPGRDEQNWLQAEAEITGAAPVAVSQEISTVAAVAETETVPLEEQIRRRAAEIYLERGSEEGHAEEHWLQAEAEICGKIQEPAPQDRRHEDRRKGTIRAMPGRRLTCIGSPAGEERRHDEDRRKGDRRIMQRRAAAAAAAATS